MSLYQFSSYIVLAVGVITFIMLIYFGIRNFKLLYKADTAQEKIRSKKRFYESLIFILIYFKSSKDIYF